MNGEGVRDADLRLNAAFGYDGGWSIERRTSKKAKARERAELFYYGRVGRREREASTAKVWRCLTCGKELHDDAHQRGPRKRWCSTKCYHRLYQRRRRAMAKPQKDNRRGEFICEHCGQAFNWKRAFASHAVVCRPGDSESVRRKRAQTNAASARYRGKKKTEDK